MGEVESYIGHTVRMSFVLRRIFWRQLSNTLFLHKLSCVFIFLINLLVSRTSQLILRSITEMLKAHTLSLHQVLSLLWLTRGSDTHVLSTSTIMVLAIVVASLGAVRYHNLFIAEFSPGRKRNAELFRRTATSVLVIMLCVA